MLKENNLLVEKYNHYSFNNKIFPIYVFVFNLKCSQTKQLKTLSIWKNRYIKIITLNTKTKNQRTETETEKSQGTYKIFPFNQLHAVESSDV